MAKVIMFPTSYELYLEGETDLLAKFTMFDSEAFEIEIKKILGSQELREIADLLDQAMKVNLNGSEAIED